MALAVSCEDSAYTLHIFPEAWYHLGLMILVVDIFIMRDVCVHIPHLELKAIEIEPMHL